MVASPVPRARNIKIEGQPVGKIGDQIFKLDINIGLHEE
jgi:hypothetical protein